ncbi:cytochrome c oxidase copper chaperone-like [Crassostrea angulata]|uniref:Cytochrome c oxidase copper chaperone n=1 Tax=Magallana gigas TaxID=29159 RepID=A0A8W8JEC2_MAGGI|nr:cytochrome c oxidase copper chaperone-like [Crassostrea gigas]XP_052709538.1 cytochrome c oxidase copper chaperone-like [Crassostrea angulata]
MGSSESTPSKQESSSEPEKKLKPCCACPETRKIRDECILENGEENCKEAIEAHKECLRKLGFKI